MPRCARTEIRGPGGSLPLHPQDGIAQDLALLIEGETSDRPLDEVLAEFGCSRSAYYEKLRRYRESGLAGLSPRPPGPRSPWRTTLDVARFVVLARLEQPERTASSIAAELEAGGATVSVRSVERILSQFGLTRRRHGRER